MELATKISMIMLNSLVVISVILCFTLVAEAQNGRVPAMFVFGDSLADVGNNDHIPGTAYEANFPPYGVTYFHYPTGRFTDGRIVFDFLAKNMGLPCFPPAYLQPMADFSCGVNFASAGSGLLDSTGTDDNIILFSQQISDFEQFSNASNLLNRGEEAKSYLAKSIYFIAIGGNDIRHFLSVLHPTNMTHKQLMNSMTSKFEEHITRLYNDGARKFLVFDISALGCTPGGRFWGSLKYGGKCHKRANHLAVEFNTAQKMIVDELNKKLDGLNIIRLNSYDYLLDMVEHGENYGFINTTGACCGSGYLNSGTLCGKTDPPILYCNNISSYLFWDSGHPTEKVYNIFANEIWGGNSSITYPFNLSTLIEL